MRRTRRGVMAVVLVMVASVAAQAQVARPAGEVGRWSPLFDVQRLAHSAVYDAIRDRMLVYGGLRPVLRGAGDLTLVPEPLADLLAYSLDAAPEWRMLAPGGRGPGGRFAHSAVFDAVQDRMLVLFGTGDGATGLADVWSLPLAGAAAWERVSVAGDAPSPRWGQAVAFDAAGARVFVYGGQDAGGALADLWQLELAGTPRWTRLDAAGLAPGARAFAHLEFDARRSRLLLTAGVVPEAGVSLPQDMLRVGARWSLAETLPVTPWVFDLASGDWRQALELAPPEPCAPELLLDAASDRLVSVAYRMEGWDVAEHPYELYSRSLSPDSAWHYTRGDGATASFTGVGEYATTILTANGLVRFGGMGPRGAAFAWPVRCSFGDAATWSVPSGQRWEGDGIAWSHEASAHRFVGLALDGSGAAPAAVRLEWWRPGESPARGGTLVAGNGPTQWCAVPAMDDARHVLWVWNEPSFDGQGMLPASLWQVTLAAEPRWQRIVTANEPPPLWGARLVLDAAREQLLAFGSGEHSASELWRLPLTGEPRWEPLALAWPAGVPDSPLPVTLVLDAARHRLLAASPAFTESLLSFDLDTPGGWQAHAIAGGMQGRWVVADLARDRLLAYGDARASDVASGQTLHALSLKEPMEWGDVETLGPPPLPGQAGLLWYEPEHDRFVLAGTNWPMLPLQQSVWQLSFATVLPPEPPHPGTDASSTALAAQPNPAGATGTTLAFRVPATAWLRLTVNDVSGRRVRVLHQGSAGAGMRTWWWDARRDDGTRAAPGVYFARLETPGSVLTRTLVLRP